MPGQVIGAGADHAPHLADTGRHQAAVGLFADPQRHIDMFIHQVHDAIGRHQIDFDFRIPGQKPGHGVIHLAGACAQRRAA